MSIKESDRYSILNKVLNREISQLKAAEILNISDRQVRNLLKTLKNSGVCGLISKKRNKPSNRKYSPEFKSRTLSLIEQQYVDFGPTLASEKLLERDEINVSKETLRQWMIETHFWIPKVRKRKIHLLRQRRQFFGEMLQGDGSHHDWFETGEHCALIYFIDDATNIITAARFEKSESLVGYFDLLHEQITSYGRPVSIYTDRFSVFETSLYKESLTQFRRALSSLDIHWIGANSPQAKGRIENCNRTLQDRLVKEMRLNKIRNIEEGNAFLKKYLIAHNNKFSKEAAKIGNLHRPLECDVDLPRTLSKYEERTLTKDFTFQFQSIHFKIFKPENIALSKKIEIRKDRNGAMRVFSGKRELEFKRLIEIYEEPIYDLKWVNKLTRATKKDHPWKQQSYSKQKKGSNCKKVYNR